MTQCETFFTDVQKYECSRGARDAHLQKAPDPRAAAVIMKAEVMPPRDAYRSTDARAEALPPHLAEAYRTGWNTAYNNCDMVQL